MTGEERLKFCGEITLAARRLGIKLREMRTEARTYYYEFRDWDTKVVIKGAPDADKKIALTNACQTLTSYLDARQK
jgi:hypothetical protein